MGKQKLKGGGSMNDILRIWFHESPVKKPLRTRERSLIAAIVKGSPCGESRLPPPKKLSRCGGGNGFRDCGCG